MSRDDYTVFTKGSISGPEIKNRLVRSGFFSLSRPFITEPDLPRRWPEGRGGKNARCISCNACLFDLKFGAREQ